MLKIKKMFNKNSSAGTAAKNRSKSSLLARLPLLLAILLLCAVFSVSAQITPSTNCLAIGKNAGYTLTTQKSVIVLGDNYPKTFKYESYHVYIDSNWWYFKTEKGKKNYKIIMDYLHKKSGIWIGGEGAYYAGLAERNRNLKDWIVDNIIPDVISHYRK